MPADPNQAKAIFLEAVEKHAPDQWPAFLDAACTGQPELRQRVEVLLAAHREAGTDPQQPVASVPAGDAGTDSAELPGTLIGPYKLLQKLGEGGMGTVYLAEQQQPVQRKVALKLIKPGMDSRQVIARFEAERQALALMDHPNIARVLDAGTVGGARDEGREASQESSPLASHLSPLVSRPSPLTSRPYFVMELVKGVPITKYCDQEHLTPKERLELFIPVCQAVQHAHQKGIIHRDLKPSNVLIALYDGKPVPKVIDFGVAKATGQKLTEKTLFTEVGQVIGTLEYMAPEQTELNNLDIDTRADIYSLGVLLYELLTGSTPFTGQQLRSAAFAEMLRMIREDEPAKPSTKLSSSGELPSIAAKRKLEPQRLCKLVAGELDWIVMKALEKERGRRYETANDLALDIQRYLANEPVLAGPPSPVYRLRKFVRRNRSAVVAAAVILLSLVGGIIGTTWGLLRAERAWQAEGERADAERRAKDEEATQRYKAQEAEKQALGSEADTQAYSQFLVEDVLSVARPEGERGGLGINVTVKQALINAAANVAERFKDRPRAEAVARHDLGVTFRLVGDSDRAVEQLKQALALRRQALGPDHPDTLNTMISLSVAYDDEKCLPLCEETFKLMKDKLGPEHASTLQSMNNLAWAYKHAGDVKRGLALYEETLKVRQATLGPDHRDTLNSMNNVAMTYFDLGNLAMAVPLLEKTLQKHKAIIGPRHPYTLTCMNNLALAYQADNKLDKALPLLKETLELRKAQLGPKHPVTLRSMNNLAAAYRLADKLDLAVALHEETLKLRREALGPEHAETLQSISNLALAYKFAGKFDKALPLMEEALKVQKSKLRPEHPATLTSMGNLAAAYLATGKPEKARPLLKAFLDGERRRQGAENPDFAGLLAAVAVELLKYGQPSDAEPLLRECLSIRNKNKLDDWKTFATKSLLGGALLGQKKYADAEPLLLAGYQGMKQQEAQIPPKVRPRLTEALEWLVQLYGATGSPDKAAEWRKKLAAAKAAKPAEARKD